MKSDIIQLIIERRRYFIASILAVTVVLAWFATRVHFDNTIETYFMEKDLDQYDEFLDVFGTDEIIAVAFDAGDAFSQRSLLLVDSLSAKIERLPHVKRVLSLTRAKLVYNESGMVHFHALVDSFNMTAAVKEGVRRRAFDDPFVPRTILSRDGRKTAVIAEIDHIIGEFDYKVALLGQIRGILQRLERDTGTHFYLGGAAVLDDALFRYNERDQGILIPAMFLVIIVVIGVMYRSFRFVLLPLAVVALSVVWTYGFMGILGYKVNLISSILPVLLMGVAIADSMHLISDYLYETAQPGRSKQKAVEEAFHNILNPAFLTSLTTVLGLLSLLGADLVPIREFGLVAAVGVASAFVITVVLVPILMLWLPFPDHAAARSGRGFSVAAILNDLGKWRPLRSGIVLLLVVLFAVPAIGLLAQLQVGTNSMDYFRRDDEVRTQAEWIDSGIGGSTSLEFLVRGEEGALKRPALLKRMLRFQNYLRDLPGITGVYSIADLSKSLNRGFNDGEAAFFTVPDSQLVVAQQLFLVEGSDDLNELVSDDYSLGRITARVELGRSQELAAKMEDIERQIRAVFTEGASVTPTGMVFLMHQMEGYLLESQIRSFLLAFVIVFLAIFIMLRSVRLGLLAIIPNLLPILMTLALMPLFDINLDVGTVMIGAIALGLVVDDTIHFLSRLKLEMASDPTRAAISKAMQATGRPIIFTSIVLSLGFLVLVLASFNPIVHFGLLLFFLVLLALVFDLVVLPALLGFTLRAIERETNLSDEVKDRAGRMV